MQPKFCLLLAGLLLAARPLFGDTVYSYTGNHFDHLDYAPVSYSTDDFLSVSFQVPDPLPGDLSHKELFPTHYTVSDGVLTLDELSVPESTFIIWTDSSGAIDEWILEFYYGGRNLFTNEHPGIVGQDGSVDSTGIGASNTNEPGVWTSSDTSAVPEPAAFWLVGAGSLGAAGVVRQKLNR